MEGDGTYGDGWEAGERHGRETEKVRLRDLLQRCENELAYIKLRFGEFKPQLLADLHKELKGR